MNKDDDTSGLRERIRNCRICKDKLCGRVDKQFCSEKCKSHYHRRLRQVTADVTADIDAILHRNRSILLEVMGKVSKKKKLARIELEKRKFNFTPLDYLASNALIYF